MASLRNVVGLGLPFLAIACSTTSIPSAPHDAAPDVPVTPEPDAAIDAGPPPPPIVSISITGDHACAIRAGKPIVCWGKNDVGQLGNGGAPIDAGVTSSFPPTEVPGVTGASALALGRFHTCAIAGGQVWCWGSNMSRQLGDPALPLALRIKPTRVPGIVGAVAIAAGENHTCAVIAGGTVKCWGTCNASHGCLGGGTLDGAGMTDVVGLTDAKAIAAGIDGTCVLTATGGVSCWGIDVEGQLGNGLPRVDSPTPTPVSVLSGVTAIAHGRNFACARINDGSVRCWGSGNNGEMGNGILGYYDLPATPSGLTEATSSIVTGANHVCVVLSSGTIKCWGNNSLAQLGTGTVTPAYIATPTPMTVFTDPVFKMVAGGSVTCVVLPTNGVQCWGGGALGDGSSVLSTTPIAVAGFP